MTEVPDLTPICYHCFKPMNETSRDGFYVNYVCSTCETISGYPSIFGNKPSSSIPVCLCCFSPFVLCGAYHFCSNPNCSSWEVRREYNEVIIYFCGILIFRKYIDKEHPICGKWKMLHNITPLLDKDHSHLHYFADRIEKSHITHIRVLR